MAPGWFTPKLPAMARTGITSKQLADHVARLADEHPPIALDSVDFTVKQPEVVRQRFATILDYLARVELEVDRNVAELQTIMPHPSDEDRAFYADVWYDQEMQHGRILDQLKLELGLPAAQPLLTVGTPLKVLGALAHLNAIQDVARTIYYFTGASTERQAVLAYNALGSAVGDLGEDALVETIVNPIKRQEPGHFAFYQMSATKITTDGTLRPWQLWLARELRKRTYELVGTHNDPVHQAEMGQLIGELGFDRDLEDYAREIGRLEARLLWASSKGMQFPPYVLKALREAVELADPRAA